MPIESGFHDQNTKISEQKNQLGFEKKIIVKVNGEHSRRMARMRRITNLWLIRFTGDRFGPLGFRLCDKKQRPTAKEEDVESEA